MLAGLLFAIDEASGATGGLVATLPLAGSTLIERQARQLVAAGAGQLVVIGASPTPELVGALNRIRRRGITVDAVNGVEAAAALLHPLARVLMLADGLVAADTAVALLAGEGPDALLVVAGEDAPAAFERIGGGAAWAGVARLDPCRLAEVAALPADYDPQSVLLRAAEAAGAERVTLPAQALADGHGIERQGDALERRGRRLVAAAVVGRHGWFDRWLAVPIARLTLPAVAASGASSAIVGGGAAAVALLGLAALTAGWLRLGMILALIATIAGGLTAGLALLREERSLTVAASVGVVAIPLVSLLALGRSVAASRADQVPLAIAIGLVVAALLSLRAAARPRSWWGSPPAYALIVAAATLPDCPVIGLSLAAGYAVATLAVAIEALREECV